MKPTKEKQNRLEKLLRSRKNWTTAARCCQLLGLRTGEAGKRMVRSMAEYSEGKVIGGQDGYKHINNANLEEVAHVSNSLDSQAKRMLKRVQEIALAYDKRFPEVQ